MKKSGFNVGNGTNGVPCRRDTLQVKISDGAGRLENTHDTSVYNASSRRHDALMLGRVRRTVRCR